MAKLNSGSASHVHFPDDQVLAHNSEIAIQSDGTGRFDIHLGFLQVNHRYNIAVNINDSLGETITSQPAASDSHVTLVSANPFDGGHQLLVDFNAVREKLMEERIVLVSKADQSKSITVVFHARVLGKGQGTPALRQGIHCIGSEDGGPSTNASATSTTTTSAKSKAS